MKRCCNTHCFRVCNTLMAIASLNSSCITGVVVPNKTQFNTPSWLQLPHPWHTVNCLFSLCWRVYYFGGVNEKLPAATKGTMNSARTNLGPESVMLVQY